MMLVTQAPHPNKWFDALTQERAVFHATNRVQLNVKKLLLQADNQPITNPAENKVKKKMQEEAKVKAVNKATETND